MCTVGYGQSFTEVVAQSLLIRFQSRLITRIAEIQTERFISDWIPKTSSKDRRQVANSPHPLLRSGGENQKHKIKGIAKTLFQVPS